jgi:hypothetical protein
MVPNPSDAEALLLAKRVARDAADQAEVSRSVYFQRSLPILVYVVGSLAVIAYERDLATFFGASKGLLMVVVVLAGGLALAFAEIAILRRKVESLFRLVQAARRDA